MGFAAVQRKACWCFVSTSFTRPLAQLVSSVQALEPGRLRLSTLNATGSDEVSTLTRPSIHAPEITETQRQLLDSERLATISRMASMIAHDLRRHFPTGGPRLRRVSFREEFERRPKTRLLPEIPDRRDRMTDEISSLLGFSKQREAVHPNAWPRGK